MATSLKHTTRRRHGHAFYTTALVVTLFAIYSFLLSPSDSLDQRHGRNALATRELRQEDLACRLVHGVKDKCAFIRSNCPDEEAGLVSYLQLYYCSLNNVKPVAFTILVVWISLLFSTIGIAASDFLCINLSTIAAILGMSESLTGVTFLALGNGSPDVFSTFAAMSTNSGSLAVGELIGAASFISAVVAGSMALVKPFQVARRSFVRDVGFFVVAASFSLIFLADGNLRLWECATMIGFYVFYVAFVVTWHWWLGRRRRMRLRENTARSHHHIPDLQELDVPHFEDDEEARPASERTNLLRGQSGDSIPRIDLNQIPAWNLQEIDDDDEDLDRYLADLQSHMRVSRSSRRERRNTITPIRPSLIGALEFRSVLNSLEKKSTTSTTINLRRYSDDPSAFLDGQSSVSQPDLTAGPSADSGEPQSSRLIGENGIRARAVSANDAVGLRLDTQFLDIPTTVAESAIYSGGSTPSAYHADPGVHGGSPQVLTSPSAPLQGLQSRSLDRTQETSGDRLAPPSSTFRRPNYSEDLQHPSHSPMLSPAMSPGQRSPQHIHPTLQSPDNEHSHSSSGRGFPIYTDSPLVSTPLHSRPPSIRLPEPSVSLGSTELAHFSDSEDGVNPIRIHKWWPYSILPSPHIITSTLFPTLYGWRGKGILDKLLGIATAPSVFLLTITLPVVEPSGEEEMPDPEPVIRTPVNQSRSSTRVTLPPDSPSMQPRLSTAEPPPHPHRRMQSRDSGFFKIADEQIDELSQPKDWNRWLVFLQVFTAPLFVVIIAWANMDEGLRTFVRMILGSLVFSLACLLVLLSTTSADHEPKYRPLFCFLGFAVAIAWISTIANEVVGVLKAFGVILGISDAILGLTIFAVGNSLGDLVADITVAKLGYPVMALSACFGGPMLNILLGIGISGMYMTISKSSHKHKKHPDRPIKYQPYEIEVSTTLMVSGLTLLVTLVGLLIVVPLNGWRMDRKIGFGLIALWGLSTISNVIIEVLGYGGELELGEPW